MFNAPPTSGIPHFGEFGCFMNSKSESSERIETGVLKIIGSFNEMKYSEITLFDFLESLNTSLCLIVVGSA